MRNQTWCSLALLGACLFLAACAYSWKKPEVSLAEVRFAGGNLFEQRLKLKLRVYNPNDREVPLESLNFELLLGETRLASGRTSRAVRIPRQGDTLVDLEATAQLASLLQALPQLDGEDGKLHYRLRGQARVEGFGDLPFDHPGELDASVLEKLGGKRGARREE